MSLGATGSALDIFERLELWEDAIKCYQRLGKMEKVTCIDFENLEERYHDIYKVNWQSQANWFTFMQSYMVVPVFIYFLL